MQVGSSEVLTRGIQVERRKCEAMLLTLGERLAFAQMLLASLDEDAQRARGRLKSSVESPMRLLRFVRH